MRPSEYLGLEYRVNTVKANIRKFYNLEYAKFIQQDLILDDFDHGKFDIIACLEVIEHVGKNNGPVLLKNIAKHMHKGSVLLLSTPCYDPKVGAAGNHIINGEIGEFTYDEMKELLEVDFNIVDQWGTFASQRDYIPHMEDWQKKMYDELSKYYESSLLSNLMAPLFPAQSRNVLWKCRLK